MAVGRRLNPTSSAPFPPACPGRSLDKMELDPDHPIINKPWEFTIADLHYHTASLGEESYIDLVLRRRTEVRRRRFWSPRQLMIEEGFPAPTRGMEILDVSARGMEGVGVRGSVRQNQTRPTSSWVIAGRTHARKCHWEAHSWWLALALMLPASGGHRRSGVLFSAPLSASSVKAFGLAAVR